MKRIGIHVMILLCFLSLAGCLDKTTTHVSISKNPSAGDVLQEDNVDILQWDGVVYQTKIDWVDQLELTKDQIIGKITKVYEEDSNHLIENGMANKLPKGTKIYSTRERIDILMVEHQGKIKRYFALTEG